MKTQLCIAAAAIVSLGIAAPAWATPAGAQLAMASFSAVNAAPDADAREAAMRANPQLHKTDCKDRPNKDCNPAKKDCTESTLKTRNDQTNRLSDPAHHSLAKAGAHA